MSRSRLVYGSIVLGLLLSQPAYAHGQEVLLFPIVLIFGLHLIPVADLFRRGLWSYAALYIFTQPAVWLLAAGTGYFFALIGGSSLGVVGGFIVLTILPFVYWRRILHWSKANVSA